MEENRTTAPKTPQCEKKSCPICMIMPFVLGLVFALVFGWWFFPHLMLKETAQPVEFTHKTHVHIAGMTCSKCHHLRGDGTFAAFPTTKECATCHQALLGRSDAERAFWDGYVRTGKNVPWRGYQKQPDNAFFSHAAHSLANCGSCHSFTEAELCSMCHPSMADSMPAYRENRLSGYTEFTMKMWQCERCHANPNHQGTTAANNACFTCHK